MQCDNCGERAAAVHLTQIVKNSVTTVHLCEPCAEEKGVQTGSAVAKFPLSDFLASIGKGKVKKKAKGMGGKLDTVEEEEEIECVSCGASLRDFRDTGRLGCPHCYDALSDHLRDLLRRIHGSSRHVGKEYVTGGSSGNREEPSLPDLRRRLQQAVEKEDFELAAQLRDQIRVLE